MSERRPAMAEAEAERIRQEYQRRAREISADRYSWSHAANRFSYMQLWRACLETLEAAGMFPMADRRVLDIGCGKGTWLMEFVQWGARPDRLSGIDLMEERVAQARENLPQADIRVGDAGHLPWADGTFDVVTQFTVFTSVLDAEVRRAMAAEMVRVVKPDGVILWYDFAFNNPQNPNVRGIPAAEIRSLFPACSSNIRRLTLAPPLARAVAPVSWMLALLLEGVPFLRTHRLACIRKLRRDA